MEPQLPTNTTLANDTDATASGDTTTRIVITPVLRRKGRGLAASTGVPRAGMSLPQLASHMALRDSGTAAATPYNESIDATPPLSPARWRESSCRDEQSPVMGRAISPLSVSQTRAEARWLAQEARMI